MRATVWAMAAMVVLSGAGSAAAVDLSNPAFTKERGATSTPVGYYQFCKMWPAECVGRDATNPVVLTDPLWQQLTSVNLAVNAAVRPVTDQDLYHVAEYWTYPQGGAGDCEDFVLEKRRELIANGWPEADLLIAVVRKLDGEGHAVLIAHTDRGDLVLDNLDGGVRVWSDTPYVYVKRQSGADNRQWVGLEDNRQILSASIK